MRPVPGTGRNRRRPQVSGGRPAAGTRRESATGAGAGRNRSAARDRRGTRAPRRGPGRSAAVITSMPRLEQPVDHPRDDSIVAGDDPGRVHHHIARLEGDLGVAPLGDPASAGAGSPWEPLTTSSDLLGEQSISRARGTRGAGREPEQSQPLRDTDVVLEGRTDQGELASLPGQAAAILRQTRSDVAGEQVIASARGPRRGFSRFRHRRSTRHRPRRTRSRWCCRSATPAHRRPPTPATLARRWSRSPPGSTRT